MSKSELNSCKHGSFVKCLTVFNEEKQGEVFAYDKRKNILFLSKFNHICYKYYVLFVNANANKWS